MGGGHQIPYVLAHLLHQHGELKARAGGRAAILEEDQQALLGIGGGDGPEVPPRQAGGRDGAAGVRKLGHKLRQSAARLRQGQRPDGGGVAVNNGSAAQEQDGLGKSIKKSAEL